MCTDSCAETAEQPLPGMPPEPSTLPFLPSTHATSDGLQLIYECLDLHDMKHLQRVSKEWHVETKSKVQQRVLRTYTSWMVQFTGGKQDICTFEKLYVCQGEGEGEGEVEGRVR